MKKLICVLFFGVFCFAACSVAPEREEKPANSTTQKADAGFSANLSSPAEKEAAKTVEQAKKDEISEAIPVTKADCAGIDVGDNAILAKQTFPVDFAPFTNSCFVTSYNPEYDDPPMESEFAIYKDGRKVFDFPSRFNGVEFGCWVEGVAFEDLNADELKDIIVVGKCSAKTAPYNENMVYVNTGRDFRTDEQANYKLADFKKIKEISDFVRQNQQIFFK
jgi:hypothetical protein